MLIIVATFILLGMCYPIPGHSHEWQGDAWAAKQITLYETVTKCVKLSEEDWPAFLKTCHPLAMIKLQVQLIDDLETALHFHLPDTMKDFIAEHTEDVMQFNKAVMTLDVVSAGLDLIKYRMETHDAFKQLNNGTMWSA